MRRKRFQIAQSAKLCSKVFMSIENISTFPRSRRLFKSMPIDFVVFYWQSLQCSRFSCLTTRREHSHQCIDDRERNTAQGFFGVFQNVFYILLRNLIVSHPIEQSLKEGTDVLSVP
jgi:hypothetical protein